MLKTPQELFKEKNDKEKNDKDKFEIYFEEWIETKVVPNITTNGYDGIIPLIIYQNQEYVRCFLREKKWDCEFFMGRKTQLCNIRIFPL